MGSDESNEPKNFSQANRAKLERRNLRIGQRLRYFSAILKSAQSARLAVGATYALILGFGASQKSGHWSLAATLLAAPVFAALVVRSRRLQNHLAELKALQEFNQRQIRRTLGDFDHNSTVVTMVDECITSEGHRALLERSSQIADSSTVRTWQNQIRQMRSLASFYTRLKVLAMAKSWASQSKHIEKTLAAPFKVADRASLAVLFVLWLAMLASILAPSPAGVVPEQIKGIALAPALVLIFAIWHFQVRQRSKAAFKSALAITSTLEQLAIIFEKIESRLATASAHPTLRKHFVETAQHGPARSARQLGWTLAILGVETNPLLAIILNAFTPWSTIGVLLLRRQRQQLSDSIPKCLDELSAFEVLGSLALFDRYQTQTYPEVSSPPLQFTELFHPFLPRERAIGSSFNEKKCLGLITGSNMSGKSTFLRSVAINQTLANMGAPVFAQAMATKPQVVATCVDVSDSLRDGFSYFYAEVRRIREIVDLAQSATPSLYLIDEIFRGTNNRERQIGSLSVLKHLARCPHAQGFVTTHDLELAELAIQSPEITPLHFRDTVENGQLSFEHRLRHGLCQTTNALVIMKLSGLAVDED